jgi:hypothetical protein
VRTLTLSGQVLLYREVNHMVVRLDREYFVRKLYGAAGLLAFII